MDRRKKFFLMSKISQRAEEMGLLLFDIVSLRMDLECADNEFNLRLEDLFNADDYNFAHDIVGIQRNLNRKTGKMENFFLPRYSSN